MGKSPPLLELGERMYGVRLPEGERKRLSDEDRKQLFIDTDDTGTLWSRAMLVYRYFTTDPEVFITNQKENATPICTQRQSPRRCPFCDSPECMHHRVGETALDYYWEAKRKFPSGRRTQLMVCSCMNKSHFFINQEFRTRKSNAARCEYCGSPHLIILGGGMAQRSIGGGISNYKSPHFLEPLILNLSEPKLEMFDPIRGLVDPIDEDPKDRIDSINAIRYRCQNCDFESTLWVIRTLKKSFVSYHQHLISHRDNLEACLEKYKGNEKSTWILRVTPGWEVVEQ